MLSQAIMVEPCPLEVTLILGLGIHLYKPKSLQKSFMNSYSHHPLADTTRTGKVCSPTAWDNKMPALSAKPIPSHALLICKAYAEFSSNRATAKFAVNKLVGISSD